MATSPCHELGAVRIVCYARERMPRAVAALILCLTACHSGCAARKPAVAPQGSATRILQTREGLASFYGREFHGRITASGVRFNMNAMVAAHPSYPFGTRVRVTNLASGRSAIVRVVDRGPARELQADGLVIDVSRRVAEVLGFVQRGVRGSGWTRWLGSVLVEVALPSDDKAGPLAKRVFSIRLRAKQIR